MDFLDKVFGKKQSLMVSKKPKYSDLGAAIGTCLVCGREVYAIPSSKIGSLVLDAELDKAESNAMWCSKCNAWFCLGDVIKPKNNYENKCPRCGNPTIVHSDR